jgi:hypothetical protein
VLVTKASARKRMAQVKREVFRGCSISDIDLNPRYKTQDAIVLEIKYRQVDAIVGEASSMDHPL